MNISYDLWPIWCDYLEENGQDTELLRYVMTYSIFNNTLSMIDIDFKEISAFQKIKFIDELGIATHIANYPTYERGNWWQYGDGTMTYRNYIY